MDETLFEAFVQSEEFALTSTPKAIKAIWKEMVEEYDIPDENVSIWVTKLLAIGRKEG